MMYEVSHYVCDCCGREYDKSDIFSVRDNEIYIPGNYKRMMNGINTGVAFTHNAILCKDCYYAIDDVIVGKVRDIRYSSDTEMAKEIYEDKEENNV